MRDPARIKRILRKVYRLWSRTSDLRLLQLLVNVSKAEAHGKTPALAFFVEDDLLEKQLDAWLSQNPVNALAELTDDAESLFIQP